MKLELKRRYYKSTYTIGDLYIDGIFYSNTLEDVPREIKKMHETCIPKGTYKVILNHSNRFDRIMPLLLNVPNFEGIRIHNGKNESSTSGCILVGKNSIVGQLTDSKNIFEKLMLILSNAKDKIEITVS